MTSRLDDVLSGSIVDEGIHGKPPESPRGKRPLMPEDFMSPVRGPEDIRRDTALRQRSDSIVSRKRRRLSDNDTDNSDDALDCSMSKSSSSSRCLILPMFPTCIDEQSAFELSRPAQLTPSPSSCSPCTTPPPATHEVKIDLLDRDCPHKSRALSSPTISPDLLITSDIGSPSSEDEIHHPCTPSITRISRVPLAPRADKTGPLPTARFPIDLGDMDFDSATESMEDIASELEAWRLKTQAKLEGSSLFRAF